ncbi:hypothetical protein HDA32_001694 [Spinactinospora alkalitolerans]|uniref:Uncharacterized protein n=1 Tax=Spinactinospora alkalitolerans TaxID=687207 RepID=A0A852TWZ3_9ACTN|nr:hypothetical protein [Spinactinospora alkalitolerans]NYE46574.1 hypothetical protein [Spinactinospora alkalitolerans]
MAGITAARRLSLPMGRRGTAPGRTRALLHSGGVGAFPAGVLFDLLGG